MKGQFWAMGGRISGAESAAQSLPRVPSVSVMRLAGHGTQV